MAVLEVLDPPDKPGPRPFTARRLALAFCAVVIAAGVGAGWLVGRHGDLDRREGWTTYANHDFGYEIQVPPGWQLHAGDPLRDPQLTTQTTELLGPRSYVSVFVNFQGDWCLDPATTVQPVMVSGNEGKLYHCPTWGYRGRESGPTTAFFFQNVNGQSNYLIMGVAVDDPQTVQDILSTFRFVD